MSWTRCCEGVGCGACRPVVVLFPSDMRSAPYEHVQDDCRACEIKRRVRRRLDEAAALKTGRVVE